MQRRTALAEGLHAHVQPRRTYARRVLYEVELSVAGLVDLTQPDALAVVGLTAADMAADSHEACQHVGGAAAWLARGGLLVPSARDPGSNLVVLVAGSGLEVNLAVVEREVIFSRSRTSRRRCP